MTLANICGRSWWALLRVTYQAKDPRPRLTWCISTGAKVSVMPESIYKPSYGTLSVSDGELIGIGDVPLVRDPRMCGNKSFSKCDNRSKNECMLSKGHQSCFYNTCHPTSWRFTKIVRLTASKLSNARLITIRSDRELKRTLSSSTRRSSKALENWRASIQPIRGKGPNPFAWPLLG